MALKAELEKRGELLVGNEDDIAATPAIAARRTAAVDVFLSVECRTAVAAVAGLDDDTRMVDKLHKSSFPISRG